MSGLICLLLFDIQREYPELSQLDWELSEVNINVVFIDLVFLSVFVSVHID